MDRGAWQVTVHGVARNGQDLATKAPNHQEGNVQNPSSLASALYDPRISVWISWLWKRQRSVQFSHTVVCESLQPNGLQDTRLPCPPSTPGACSNSCPLSRCCHPTTSSSVVSFSSHPQSFPGSGSFQMSQFFTSGGQSIGVLASASVLPMNSQD